MGDTQSSQSQVEQQEQDVVREKPWSPDDISDSSSEENAATTKVAPLPTEPEPPPSLAQRAQKAQKAAKQGKTRKSKSRSGSESVRSEILDDDNEQVTETKTAQTSQQHSGATETLDASRSWLERKTRKNKFEELEGQVFHPQLTDKNPEDENAQVTQELVANEVNAASDEVAVGSESLQLQSKADKERLPCPQANMYDCEKTFASEASAKRHARAHVGGQTFVCLVCSKTYSRADKLKTHTLNHSREDLVAATARAEAQDKAEPQRTGELLDNAQATVDESEPQQDIQDSGESLRDISDSLPATLSQENNVSAEGVEQSSTKVSDSSASIFDEPVDIELIEETPRPKARLKRKRDIVKANEPAESSIVTSRKRRRRHSLSPPTSVASHEDQSDETEQQTNNIEDKAISFSLPKTTKAKSVKTGNLDNFAKPWTPGSQLHHPIHNPRSPKGSSSQRVQVVLPNSSKAGPSSVLAKKTRLRLSNQNAEDIEKEQPYLGSKRQQVVYTSPKGKRKAESGVTYSSPPVRTDADGDEAEANEPEGMATTFARKGVSQGKGRKEAIKEKFQTTTADAPDSDIESDTGRAGRKGAFSHGEVQKLERWRDRFCQDNDLNIPTFNQMMTDSCRRSKSFQWPYRFVTKADFLQEYYDVLPERDRRSMHRYRERNFQNIPEKQEWTEEDDEELLQLVKELGPKWVEIGQRMTRTQDSVNQRWRFKVRYRGRTNQGEWLKTEGDKLEEAVAQVKRESGLPLDPNADVRIPWESVSKKLKERRTAQQCSNKWRLMHQVRKGNRFAKPSDIDRKLGTPSTMATPSKMSQRLAGQTHSQRRSGSSSKKMMSAKFVYDSDNESDSQDEQSGRDSEVSESESNQNNSNRKSSASEGKRAQARTSSEVSKSSPEAESPASRQDRLTSQTPQTGKELSQAFAQTQANTSALRAPTTTRKPHTQTDMPTPGLPIQHRPASSPWLAVNSDRPDANAIETESVQGEDMQATQDREDAIMADPESSDDETQSIDEASQASDPDNDASNDGAEAEAEAEAASEETTSSSETASDKSTETDAEDFERDGMIQDTQKDSFLQSLQSPSNTSPSSSKPGRTVAPKRSQGKIDWEQVLRGNIAQDDSESNSEDEGDIMHH